MASPLDSLWSTWTQNLDFMSIGFRVYFFLFLGVLCKITMRACAYAHARLFFSLFCAHVEKRLLLSGCRQATSVPDPPKLGPCHYHMIMLGSHFGGVRVTKLLPMKNHKPQEKTYFVPLDLAVTTVAENTVIAVWLY